MLTRHAFIAVNSFLLKITKYVALVVGQPLICHEQNNKWTYMP